MKYNNNFILENYQINIVIKDNYYYYYYLIGIYFIHTHTHTYICILYKKLYCCGTIYVLENNNYMYMR